MKISPPPTGAAPPPPPALPAQGRWYTRLYPQVLVAIALGVLVGVVSPATGQALQPLGEAFIKLVKTIIAPVIFLTIVTGIAGMRDLKGVGRVAAKAFAYFLVFSLVALVVGLVVADTVRPGAGMHVNPATLNDARIGDYAQKAHASTLVGFLLAIIPDTFLSALTQGNILQVLFVAITFGVALVLVGERAERVLVFLVDLEAVVFRLVGILMRAAPVGAFGAMAFTVGKYGVGTLKNLGLLVGTFYLTSAAFVFLVLGLVARLCGFSILALIRYLRAELLLVLGTSSSESALPPLIEKMERAGCPKSVVGLVVPTGYSFNLDGTNIYMTLAALFIAQACDVPLTLGQELLLLGVAMLSSKGAAGVTGAGFITLAATLSIVPTVPVAGMALILGVDRFMSECRSLTNFIGNAVATVVVSRWEGVFDAARFQAAVRGDAPPIGHASSGQAAPERTTPGPAGAG